MINANIVAKYIIEYSRKIKDDNLTNLKLQKLLYYIALYYFSKTRRRLYKEDIVYWRHGPVVEDVYSNYRYRTNMTLKEPCPYVNFPDINNKKLEDIIKLVISAYSEYEPWDMVDKTKKELEYVFSEIDENILTYTKNKEHKIINMNVFCEILKMFPYCVFREID